LRDIAQVCANNKEKELQGKVTAGSRDIAQVCADTL
jgi:hypothetical protein